MKISDLVAVNTDFKKHRKAISLAASIERRITFYRKHFPDGWSEYHASASADALAALRHFAEFSAHRREINTILSSRALLTHPVATTMATIFKGLPPPGKAQLSHFETAITDQMALFYRESRAKIYRVELMFDLAFYASSPLIFNTLTVRPGEYSNVFSRNSTAFKNYIRRFQKIMGQGPYLAVVEEGPSTGRLHIHVVHICSRTNFDDPNKNVVVPTRREASWLRSCWPYGFCSPIIVRTSPNDAWGRAGFRWPFDTRSDGPLPVSSPLKLASYLSKYLTKTYLSPKRRKYQWRVRKSHQLGRPLVANIMSNLSHTALTAIASTPPTVRLNNTTIPDRLIRLGALRQLLTLNRSELTSTAKRLQSALSPLTALRGSNLTSTAFSPPNITNIKTLGLDNEAISDAHAALQAQITRVNREFFPQTDVQHGSYSTADYIYSQS
jgi:hypothetical protein